MMIMLTFGTSGLNMRTGFGNNAEYAIFIKVSVLHNGIDPHCFHRLADLFRIMPLAAG
jgi:hypothetical protein